MLSKICLNKKLTKIHHPSQRSINSEIIADNGLLQFDYEKATLIDMGVNLFLLPFSTCIRKS